MTYRDHLFTTIWVLGIKLRLSVLVASDLMYGTILPFLVQIGQMLTVELAGQNGTGL